MNNINVPSDLDDEWFSPDEPPEKDEPIIAELSDLTLIHARFRNNKWVTLDSNERVLNNINRWHYIQKNT